jgi:cytochrome d ubiquinol oxidase subunit I
MVGIGLFMIAAAFAGAFFWWRGTLFEQRWYLRIMAHCWWIGFVAVIAGWVVTESGRQPWLVQGILRTADATSPVPGATIAGTLALFVVAYGVVFWFGIYYINRLIAHGPAGPEAQETGEFSASPIAAARASGRPTMR